MQSRTHPVYRYSLIAIILHWVMAVAFILMIGSGLAFENWEGMPQDLKFNVIQWHKSLGILLLISFFIRLGIRLIKPPPPQEPDLSQFDRKAAKGLHWLFYVIMIVMPLSGWIMVSSSSYGLPTYIFGLFEWPHIPSLSANREVRGLSGEIHKIVAYVFIVMIMIHVGAVIKHYIFERLNLLPRMGIGKTRS